MAGLQPTDVKAFAALLVHAREQDFISDAQHQLLIGLQENGCSSLECHRIAEQLLRGCPVVVRGLKAASELNGSHGRCARLLPDGGRFAVDIAPAGSIEVNYSLSRSIRLINLGLPTAPQEAVLFTPSDTDDNAVSRAAMDEALSAIVHEGEERCCRVCFDDEVRVVRPCACRGSQAFSCLQCVTTAEVTAWLHGQPVSYDCKQCKQRYSPDACLAIGRGKVRAAKEKRNAAEGDEVALWQQVVEDEEINLGTVALVEFGRWHGHATPVGREALREAEQLTRRYLEAAEQGDRHDPCWLRVSLAETCRYARRLDEAEALHRYTIEHLPAQQDRDLLEGQVREMLGNCLVSQGAARLAEAEELLRRSLALREACDAREGPAAASQGPSQQTLISLSCLARCLGKKEDLRSLQAAEELARRVWLLRSKIFGREHVDTTAAARFVDSLRAKQCRAAFADGMRALTCGVD